MRTYLCPQRERDPFDCWLSDVVVATVLLHHNSVHYYNSQEEKDKRLSLDRHTVKTTVPSPHGHSHRHLPASYSVSFSVVVHFTATMSCTS